MLKLDEPLQLSPVFKEKVWGRQNLAPLYPDHWTTSRGQEISTRRPRGKRGRLIGEVWLTDDAATFTNGALAGKTLAAACAEYGPDLCGEHAPDGRFPVLAKFLFTSDWLSVQVHPDDAYAREHEAGSRGKCEMWYIIGTDPDAAMLLGVKPGVGAEAFRQAVAAGESEPLLQRFTPRNEEAMFVPPGTVHALGPGLILFEAEENSDVTYRLDDFGRVGVDGKPRPLHLRKAIEVAKPELTARRNLPRLEIAEKFGKRRMVVASPFFAVEELRMEKPGNFSGRKGRVEAFTVVAGEGRVETARGWYAYRTGDVWLIPPATLNYRLVPEETSSLLKFYVPDPDKDFRAPLEKAGLDSAAVIFN